MPSFKPVVALLRGLDVLQAVNAAREATVGSVHAATGLDKATVVRMLETLEHAGYIVRVAGRPAYVPSWRTLQLSQGYDLQRSLGAAAEPILTDFRKSIGWPSDLAICDRGAMIVVQTSREQGPLSLNRRPGYQAPILSTSLGRAYLAFCPDEERQAILAQIAARPNAESVDLSKADAILAEVRERGFSVMDSTYSDREYEGLVWAIAVPVMNGERACASVNILMLRNAMSYEMAVDRLLEPLKATAARLAEVFRAQG